MQVKLIAITRYLSQDGAPEALIEHAGRICYQSEKAVNSAAGDLDVTARFIQRRLQEGHESIIEHASASFEISGISRACSHQLVRHRLASYSQESQRYVDMSRQCEASQDYVIPPDIANDPEAMTIWSESVGQLATIYQRLRKRGIKKEDARFLLPNATATRLVMTANFRELLHIFKLRISPEAQWEIRALCVRMLEAVYPHAPNVFGLLRDQLRETHPSFFADADTQERS